MDLISQSIENVDELAKICINNNKNAVDNASIGRIHPNIHTYYNSVNIFVGPQGSGKTYSAMTEIIKIFCEAYTKANEKVRVRMGNIPKVGNKIVKLTSRIKNSIKQIFISKMYFEDIGYTYLGPVDGNDIEAVEEILAQSKKCKGPVLVHVVTKKGKGYKLAEKNPSKFHGTAPFDKKTGEVLKAKSKDYSKVFGEKLVEIAKNDNRIVAITAAMADGTGLSEFKKKYPKRFFDVGIAEQHAIGMAAGMAKSGLIPVVPIYSSFYQRAYDQVIHDVCMQNLHVIMCADRAGIVGNDRLYGR